MSEKIQTEDVKYCHDEKIYARHQHSNLNISQDESYDSVLNKVDNRIPTQDQKDALTAGFNPSGSNRFVTYDDIQNVIKLLDLGDLKDAVNDITDLPLQLTNTSLIRSSNVVTVITSSAHNYQLGQEAYISSAVPTEFNGHFTVDSIPLPNQYTYHLTGTDETATNAGQGINKDGDLRPVINARMIYRYTTLLGWQPFIQTGYSEHPDLLNQNGDVNYQHLTLTEKTNLITDEHTHSNKTVLDSITDAGSGQIITTDERNRLPSQDQKDALQGTYGTPSNTNRYVTNSDPRIINLATPWVTVGPVSSGATFETADETGFNSALATLTATGGTLCVFKGSYTLNNPIIWNTNKPLSIVNFSPETAILNVGFAGNGLQLTSNYICTVYGLTFNISNSSAIGLYSTAPTIAERLETLGTGLIGLGFYAQNNIVQNCNIQGNFNSGIYLDNSYNKIVNSYFDLNTASLDAIYINTGSNFLISGNTFKTGRINIPSTSVTDTIISHNHFISASIINNSIPTTRIYLNLPDTINNVPFIPTVSTSSSYGDYRGDDQIPINNAISALGSNGGIIHLMSGTYTITSSITINKSIKIICDSNVILTSSVAPIFSLATGADLILENANLSLSGAFNIISYTGTPKATFYKCSFTANAANYVISSATINDWEFRDCSFFGGNGLGLNVGYRNKIDSCIFNLTNPSNVAITSSDYDTIISNNSFVSGSFTISGTRAVISANNFGTNTVYNTGTNNIFTGNYPKDKNNSGTDSVSINMLKGFIQTSANANNLIDLESQIVTSAGIKTFNFPNPLDKEIISVIYRYWDASEFKYYIYSAADIETYRTNAQIVYNAPSELYDVGDYFEAVVLLYISPSLVSGVDDINVGTVYVFGDTVNVSIITSFAEIPYTVDTASTYNINLVWSSEATTGDVKWKLTATFLDETNNILGDPVINYFVTTRSGLNSRRPQKDTFTFPANYGSGVIVPSSVAISIERDAVDIEDTMAASALLFSAYLNLPTLI